MLEPGILALFIPIIALCIPIVAMLAKHQREMAEVFAKQRGQESNPEINLLRKELYELKQLVQQQSIAIDNLATLPRSTVSVEERLSPPNQTTY